MTVHDTFAQANDLRDASKARGRAKGRERWERISEVECITRRITDRSVVWDRLTGQRQFEKLGGHKGDWTRVHAKLRRVKLPWVYISVLYLPIFSFCLSPSPSLSLSWLLCVFPFTLIHIFRILLYLTYNIATFFTSYSCFFFLEQLLLMWEKKLMCLCNLFPSTRGRYDRSSRQIVNNTLMPAPWNCVRAFVLTVGDMQFVGFGLIEIRVLKT